MKIKLNTIPLNIVNLNINAAISEESSGDIPEEYVEFITADGMVFSASDGAFYVKL